MKQLVLALVATMCCTLVGLTVEAAPDDAAVKLAKAHYEKGNAAYNLGKFDEAIGWFTKAYEAWPMPDFLYNIAQSYRLEGNCKQALFVYKRYLSIKERDKTAPLGQDERAEIERFVKELSDCAAKTDASAAQQPDALKTTPPNPPPATPTSTATAPTRTPTPTATAANPTTATTTTTTTTTAPAKPAAITTNVPTTAPTTAAIVTPATTAPVGEERERHDPEVSSGATSNAKRLSAYATGGIAMFSAGRDLPIPVQPSLALGVSYPLPVGSLVLDLGVRASFSPIKYDTMNTTEQASLVGIHATLGVAYQVNDKLDLRGDVGIGATMLLGLMDDNPFTSTHEAGTFTMPSFRIGVAAEYTITPNLVATVAPFSFGFSPAPDGLVISSLTEIDVLAGLAWRR